MLNVLRPWWWCPIGSPGFRIGSAARFCPFQQTLRNHNLEPLPIGNVLVTAWEHKTRHQALGRRSRLSSCGNGRCMEREVCLMTTRWKSYEMKKQGKFGSSYRTHISAAWRLETYEWQRFGHNGSAGDLVWNQSSRWKGLTVYQSSTLVEFEGAVAFIRQDPAGIFTRAKGPLYMVADNYRIQKILWSFHFETPWNSWLFGSSMKFFTELPSTVRSVWNRHALWWFDK